MDRLASFGELHSYLAGISPFREGGLTVRGWVNLIEAGAWKEHLHPRASDGKFGSGGGGSSAGGSGQPSVSGSAARGMPDTIASSNITLSGGGTATLARHADGGLSIGDGTHSSRPLTAQQGGKLLDTLAVADDWDPGDSETLPGVGRITRERGGYQVDLDDGPSLKLSSRDVTRMETANEQLGKSSRMDTGNGDLDVFSDGKKIGFRHLGDDGRPVEVTFNRSSANKISRVVDGFIDDIDDPDTPAKDTYTKDVATNAGKVRVTMHGNWGGTNPGDRLTVMPVDGDDWGIVVDGPQQQKWGDAMSKLLDEAEPATACNLTEQVSLTEAMTGVGDMQAVGKGRYRVLLIRAGQGSSGYYYPEVLRRDGPKIFPAGTRMYMDHPTLTERAERPEGSTLNWASVTTTDPVWDPVEKGLVAEVEVFPHWRSVLNPEYAKHLGLSIRATGTVESGEVDGQRTLIVTSLDEGTSVDWVTQAGAGGRVLQLIESARDENLAPPFKKKDAKAKNEKPDDAEDAEPDDDDEEEEEDEDKLPFFLRSKESAVSEARTVGGWLESRIHLTFTTLADDLRGEGHLTRAERIALSAAIGDALAAFTGRVETDSPRLYHRDLWDEPAPDEPNTITKGAPMDGSTTAEQAPPDRGTDVTESARVTELTAQLAEARQTASAELAELKRRLDESDADKRALANDKAARTAVSEALTISGLPAAAHLRVTESVCRALPTTESGTLDVVKLGESIKTAVADEQTYIATLAEAAGAGMPRGLGATVAQELSESDVNKELASVFAGIGMNEQAALTAAQGRG